MMLSNEFLSAVPDIWEYMCKRERVRESEQEATLGKGGTNSAQIVWKCKDRNNHAVCWLHIRRGIPCRSLLCAICICYGCVRRMMTCIVLWARTHTYTRTHTSASYAAVVPADMHPGIIHPRSPPPCRQPFRRDYAEKIFGPLHVLFWSGPAHETCCLWLWNAKLRRRPTRRQHRCTMIMMMMVAMMMQGTRSQNWIVIFCVSTWCADVCVWYIHIFILYVAFVGVNLHVYFIYYVWWHYRRVLGRCSVLRRRVLFQTLANHKQIQARTLRKLTHSTSACVVAYMRMIPVTTYNLVTSLSKHI